MKHSQKISPKNSPVKITFTGCKHLDFGDEYTCRKQIMGNAGEPTVFWMRDVPSDLPSMVQFCKLRGRLNNPHACLTEETRMCPEYEEIKHTVEVPDP